jgi:Flp pilus assembly pilin Flp
MSRLIRMFHNDESGQDLIEYALVSLSIATATITAFQGIATKVGNAIDTLNTNLANL